MRTHWQPPIEKIFPRSLVKHKSPQFRVILDLKFATKFWFDNHHTSQWTNYPNDSARTPTYIDPPQTSALLWIPWWNWRQTKKPIRGLGSNDPEVSIPREKISYRFCANSTAILLQSWTFKIKTKIHPRTHCKPHLRNTIMQSLVFILAK